MSIFRGSALFLALLSITVAPALADGWAHIYNKSSNCVTFYLQPLFYTQPNRGPQPVGAPQKQTLAAGTHLSVYVHHGTPYYKVTAHPHHTDCSSAESGHTETIWPNIASTNTMITYAAGGHLSDRP